MNYCSTYGILRRVVVTVVLNARA